MNPALAIFLVLSLLGGLFVAAHKLPLSGELSRKMVHIGMGSICMSFPWLFQEAWPVDLLAILAVTSLLGLRWLQPTLGSVLYRVQRLSFGELLFPIGVAIVFRLSAGDASMFLPSVGVLTFGDAAGALIGKRFGKHRYHTNAGEKSIEGSLAVFVVSFLIVLLTGISNDLPTALLIATVVGLVAMMSEGVLGAGTDNLILPLAVYGLLFFLRDLTWSELLSRIGIIGALAAGLFCVRRLTSLNGGGLLSTTIFGYLCYALGGAAYLLAPLLLFLIHLGTTWRFPDLRKMEHSADAVAAAVIPGLIWLTVKATTNIPEATCHLGFCLTMAAQGALLHTATRNHLKKDPASILCAFKVLLIMLASPVWVPLGPLTAILLAAFTRKLGDTSRLQQFTLALLFSLSAFLF